MKINLPRLNWFIYESDIITLGGMVTYTDHVIVKNRRSVVREAVVTLLNSRVSVYMECFCDGTSVLCNFLDNGKPVRKNTSSIQRFLKIYNSLRCDNEVFFEFTFIRSAKQILVFIAQIFSVIVLIHSICCVSQSIFYMIELFGACVLFYLCMKAYARIRKMRFETYTTLFKDLD